MTTRWLPESEWGKIEAQFTARGVSLPHPAWAKIRVAEDGDRIVAFLVAQFQMHAEPLWIDADYSGRVWWPGMLGAIEAEYPGIYVFAPNEDIAAMCESQDLTRLPWAVFHREAR